MTRSTRIPFQPNRSRPLRAVLAAALFGGLVANAVAEPPGGHGPPGPPPVPSAEALATIPALSPAQQIELRKILLERRDAHEALHDKSRAAMEAQMSKDRAEHERIDEQGSERLRKLLGEDGFRSYAQWELGHRPGPGRGDEAGPRGPRPGGPGGRGEGMPPRPAADADAPPPPAPPSAGGQRP